MVKAKKVTQLSVTTEDKPGMLAEVSSSVSAAGVNIETICAYSMEGKAIFYMVTQDNAKAKEALSAKGWPVENEEVVMLELENKPGALGEVSAKLKEKAVNLVYCYGTTCCEETSLCRFILKAENNDAAIEALK